MIFSPSIPHRFRTVLGFETLESRDCPSIGNIAPEITGLNIVEMSNNVVQISGYVEDEIPETVTMGFSGLVTDTFALDSSGYFSEMYQVASQGTLNVTATDEESEVGSAQAEFSSVTPYIELEYQWASTGKQVILWGTVTDEFIEGETVTFSGAVSGSTTVNSMGQFYITLEASQLGQITATIADQWNQSAQDSVTLTNSAPVIDSFSVEYQGYGIFYITGYVNDEQPGGLKVHIGGLTNTWIDVNEGGTFEATLYLPQYTGGTFTAMVTDWWGVESAIVEDDA